MPGPPGWYRSRPRQSGPRGRGVVLERHVRNAGTFSGRPSASLPLDVRVSRWRSILGDLSARRGSFD
jgi:hypothetical protein